MPEKLEEDSNDSLISSQPSALSSWTSYVFCRMNKDVTLFFDSDKDQLDHGASKESMIPVGARSNFIGSFDAP